MDVENIYEVPLALEREDIAAGETLLCQAEPLEDLVVDAREIEVSVLGNEEPSASIPGEVVPSREFYDYVSKYLDDGEDASELLIPAPLDDAMTKYIQEQAIEAYRAIDGAGMARVDFLLSRGWLPWAQEESQGV